MFCSDNVGLYLSTIIEALDPNDVNTDNTMVTDTSEIIGDAANNLVSIDQIDTIDWDEIANLGWLSCETDNDAYAPLPKPANHSEQQHSEKQQMSSE